MGVDQLQNLVGSLKKFYEIVLDPTGRKYCGITLEWDYENITDDLSMPNYVSTKLKYFDRPNPSCYLRVHRMHAYTGPVVTYLPPSTINTRR